MNRTDLNKVDWQELKSKLTKKIKKEEQFINRLRVAVEKEKAQLSGIMKLYKIR